MVAENFTTRSGEQMSGAQSAGRHARPHARHSRRAAHGVLTRPTKLVAALSAMLLPIALGLPNIAANAAVAPVGQGFTVTPGDLAFILKQIKIGERHSRAFLGTDPSIPANPSPATDPNYCQSMLGTASDQIPDALTSYGLRTVDGSCNNLIPGRDKFAAADVPFPRLTTPVFKTAEGVAAGFFGPGSPAVASSSYAQKSGNVFDSQPRTISNLIDDQTSTNPAAVAAAAHPVRVQAGTTGVVVCQVPPAVDLVTLIPVPCTPEHKTLFIPNVTTDVGLSPPYNSLFTFFGQFFDHGVDQTVKSGGTVFVPLKADDPLRTLGPDGIAGTNCGTAAALNCDEVPASQAFMVLTRAQNQPGPDGVLGTADDIQDATNTDTPWVDQSQTYTSHASHQVFLREYALNAANRPVSTGKLLGGLPDGQTYLNSPDGTTGISTWAAVKLQAANKLGLRLVDRDVTNIPMIATDPYGKFTPGPLRGLPQYVTATGLVEGNLGAPVPVPANVLHFDTPFLTDIAHNADPSPQTDPATGAVIIPVPDQDNTPSANFAAQPAGTYDDEMLNAHFACGDGRCNENIALSSIHQVFHSEHDRLVDYIKNVLTTDTSPTGVAALPEWQLPTAQSPDGWNGERLFQAARFVNEMEYQHAVFEEFARKVQPAVRPFHVYSPDINPAIKAEFAHAVYRFGHSMLDDTVARTNTDPVTGVKSDNSIPLLTAFLNPPEYFNAGVGKPALTPEQAAGSIFMGSSDQVGNELDEFVTETLRNNLLGLPLDLPTLNMTRAREAGVPPLNEVRRQIFATTNDGQLAPYKSWSDFGQNIKHPESLINFVAAYGTHPTITSATTLLGKRLAARAIVDPLPTDVVPADAASFMFGTGAWANTAAGVTITGLDNVDLWVGGLAEITNLFGGLLGSTFNYVFQSQLESLQDGDRLYYLARTPGLNLRTQLEGNSFAELIQRNTDNTNSLKADAFATADCRFELANLTSPAVPPAVVPPGFISGVGSVNDDPTTTDCNENLLLMKQPDGTIQYRQVNSVDPVGINGQSVYNGTPGADRIWGGNDNDTFWGGAGNDVIEGNGGDDVALGGDGNDIITDLSGADVLKGGPGNDAIDAGIGNDILLGGDGSDFMNGGANDNESFGGPGNDFIIAGQGADAVFGDGGDDWIEGGTGQDLLQGDHGAPFFDDPGEAAPGNDIFIGQPGENDYDAEGGDDIMAQNPAIDRNAGAGGFDWAIHQYNTTPANDDMMINNNLGGLPIQVIVNRDRWQETEADSGSAFNDVIKGTDGVLATPRLISGAGFQGCDALDQTGVARIKGLADLLPPVSAWLGDSTAVAALSASGRCPLVGPVWGEGDILLGGAGSDTFTGRAGNDIIDGNAELRVRISVRDAAGAEIGTTDLMEHQYLHNGPALLPTGELDTSNFTGPTLQQAVFAGTVDPGNLVSVREIVHPAAVNLDGTQALDTAVFSGVRANYTITTVPAGAAVGAPGAVTTVTDNVGLDGTDTLRNVEALQFADTATPGAPTGVTAVGGIGRATVTWVAPVLGKVAQVVTGYTVEATDAGTGVARTFPAAGGTTSLVVNGLTPGSYTFRVQASNAAATPQAGPWSLPTGAVSVTLAGVPGAPTGVSATAGPASANVSWTPPVSDGGSPITGFAIDVISGATVVNTVTGIPATATSQLISGLTNGTTFSFVVHAVNAAGTGAGSATSNLVTPATVPDAPTIGTATAGNASASVTWTAPANTGGSAITGYSVLVVDSAGAPVGLLRPAAAGATSLTVTGLVNGQSYRFQVQASNTVGAGLFSGLSNAVTPATVPDAPAIGTATSGNASATVTWSAPANGGSVITGFSVRVVDAASVQVGALQPAAAGATSLTATGLVNGQSYRFQVQASNAVGAGPFSGLSNAVTPAMVPGAPLIGTATRGNASALVRWTAPANGGSAITGYSVRVAIAATNVQVGALRPAAAGATSLTVTGLVNGQSYRFQVQATNAVGTGPFSALSNAVTPARVPGAARIGAATSGLAGGVINATARWTPPVSNGGSAINGYVVTALRINAAGAVVGQATSRVQAATARSLTMTLASGRYRFVVRARNVLGLGANSARSNLVTAR
jgi:Ca2+-binding RTX toxin-like protein